QATRPRRPRAASPGNTAAVIQPTNTSGSQPALSAVPVIRPVTSSPAVAARTAGTVLRRLRALASKNAATSGATNTGPPGYSRAAYRATTPPATSIATTGARCRSDSDTPATTRQPYPTASKAR